MSEEAPRYVRYFWTPETAEKLRKAWHDPKVLNEELPAITGRTLDACRAKAQLMRLGKRPPQADGKRLAAAQRRLVQQMGETHRHRIAALQTDLKEPVELAAPGIRETQRLVQARMLLQRGISVDTIVYGLRLTAVEVATLRGAA